MRESWNQMTIATSVQCKMFLIILGILLFNVLKKKIKKLQGFDSANGKWSLKDHLNHIKPNLKYEILLSKYTVLFQKFMTFIILILIMKLQGIHKTLMNFEMT